MEGRRTLSIAYGADDNYAKYLGISMLSLFQTNKDFESIDVYIMDCEIGNSNKEKLISIAEEYNRNIFFISMKDYVSKLNLNMGARNISIASYARLFLATVIPQTCKKILYLDCDTIVSDKVSDFWNMDMEGYMVAGVQDTVDKYFLKKIGLNVDDYYVNAGVILINLSAWRESNIQQQFMNFIEKFNGNVPHHDQGTINALCLGKISFISPKYNVTSNIYSFSAKTIKRMYSMSKFYSQDDLNEAKSKPVIIHYTTGLVGRPWEEKCTHPKKDKYIRVAMDSPWKKDPLLADSRKLSVKAFSVFYNFTPKFLSSTIYKLSNWLTHLRE